ncbi:BNR repeat-containing protein [Glycomyces sp. TRM65418]|uniref:BNR-4 repeat-containing protein n=1 Tax=Glycomyces sp. TRM65418 TaxID=2867006 RepID=UPI001CE50618|nr:BNR-4 repeat-containing protein [Glycomyces sp. TRM65418]MCC3761826.1 BNR repeat-containing protein [Glycomyces sp. TRM65418]QZD55908.1 BNR repeat-containing protein [Glycomyces sp. TRM65418]
MHPSGPAEPIVVNDNGAWCWFQDERALVDPETQTLVAGSIAAAEGPGGEARSGNVELSVVDLRSGASTVVVLHERMEVDDHDVPALWRRSDGRWLAVYTKHKSDDLTRWRISEPGDPTRWGPERTFDWSPFTGGRGVTYSNLRAMGGRLYCFARAVNDDQCALVSDDEGETWAYAGKLFTRPKVGYVNGYTRYAANGDRIDLVTTDHHPRDFDNSVYHGYLEDGALRRSDGSVLDPAALQGDAPTQADLTTVLAAGSRWGGERMSHCWTTDIRTGADGSVAAVLTSRAGEDELDLDRGEAAPDLRFFYARMSPGGEWTVNELAKAGPGLMPHEQDYTGLAAIDPYDLGSVFVSTPIDPRDGSALAHREIFHGRAAAAGAFWAWTPVTESSEVDNLRPIVAPGDPSRTPLLWFRGPMTASQHYRCEVVLLDLPRA